MNILNRILLEVRHKRIVLMSKHGAKTGVCNCMIMWLLKSLLHDYVVFQVSAAGNMNNVSSQFFRIRLKRRVRNYQSITRVNKQIKENIVQYATASWKPDWFSGKNQQGFKSLRKEVGLSEQIKLQEILYI